MVLCRRLSNTSLTGRRYFWASANVYKLKFKGAAKWIDTIVSSNHVWDRLVKVERTHGDGRVEDLDVSVANPRVGYVACDQFLGGPLIGRKTEMLIKLTFTVPVDSVGEVAGQTQYQKPPNVD